MEFQSINTLLYQQVHDDVKLFTHLYLLVFIYFLYL